MNSTRNFSNRFRFKNLRVVRPPWGVLLCAIGLLAYVVYVFFLGHTQVTAIGAAFTLGVGAVALGLFLLRPWAYWCVVFAACVMAFVMGFGGAAALLSYAGFDFGESNKPPQNPIEEWIGFFGASVIVLSYFFSRPIRASFVHRDVQAGDFPEFSLGCLVIIGLIVSAVVLGLVVVYVSCATGGECL